MSRRCPILQTAVVCARDCVECRIDHEERAAILEFGQGTGGSPERPTCATRADAEAMAREQLRDALAR
jgi:hypothetical protein